MSKIMSAAEYEEARRGWLRLSDHPGFVPVDPDLVRFVQKRIASAPSGLVSDDVRLAAAKDYLPPTRDVAPLMLGYVQGALIGSLVYPEFTSRKEKASYPIQDKSKFVINDKPIGSDGSKDTVDTSLTWKEVSVKMYGADTIIENRERDEAEGNLPAGVTVDDLKLEAIQGPYQVLKEKHQATSARTTANYGSTLAAHYRTLASETQWSHSNGAFIDDAMIARRVVEKTALTSPDLQWFSGDAFAAARQNAQVKEAVKYTGTMERPGNVVPIETIVALLGMNVVVAGAFAINTPGGTVSELWGQDAGMVCTGGGAVVGVRFGVTVTHIKYPYTNIEPSGKLGARGGETLTFTDAWGLDINDANAGYLWVNASKVYGVDA